MKETLKISDRFNLVKKLGQGTFSFIYEAHDKKLQKNVALKIEKKDKNKSILIFEYNVLNVLKGLSHVCNVYDFVKNSEQNLIVMDLLGNNLAKVRKCLEENYNLKIAIQLLIEMLDAIEEVHDRGFIHRDVKASNFVLSQDNRHVYIVDFGLAKKHLDDNSNPVQQRKKADFRGTVSFASLNAHNNIDLSRRDDIWSLYFVILDFLNEKLKWREQKEYTMDEVKNIKTECLSNPEEKLWIVTKDIPEVKNIFSHIQSLGYKDKPNYGFIRNQLKSIYARNMDITQSICSSQQLQVRGGQCGMQHMLLQHPPHQGGAFPFMQAQPGFNPKTMQQLPPPNSVVEFQTPERPSNHQRCLHQNFQSTPSTSQNNQSIINDEAAFSRASPNNLTPQQLQQQTQQPFNFPHFYVQTMPRNKSGQPNEAINNQPGCLSPVRTLGIKRKAAEPLLDELRAAASTDTQNPDSKQLMSDPQVQQVDLEKQKLYAQNKKGQDIQCQQQIRKRDMKKNNVNVIQDEEPLFSKQRSEGDMLSQPSLNSNPNGVYYQFPPNNPNCVNQHININQNFFLSPPFILFYNDQQENGIQPTTDLVNPFNTQMNPPQAQPGAMNQSKFPAPPMDNHMLQSQGLLNMHPGAPNLFNNKFQQQPLFQQNNMFDPSRLNRPDMMRREDKPQGPFLITAPMKDGVQQPFAVTKPQGPAQLTQQMVADSFQQKKALYNYNPNKVEIKNGPIFRVETDRDLYRRVYKQSNMQLLQETEQRHDQLIYVPNQVLPQPTFVGQSDPCLSNQ